MEASQVKDSEWSDLLRVRRPSMAPQSPVAGLIVSKLGIEATASGDKVSGILCLKVSSAQYIVQSLGDPWSS